MSAGAGFELSAVAALPGVMGAAVLGVDGELLERLDVQDGFPEQGLTAAMAAAGVLSESVGGSLRQAVFAYRGGPWLLVALPQTAGGQQAEHTLALRLSGLSDLARLRFELPRLLGAGKGAGPVD